jgi:hypothetical protein
MSEQTNPRGKNYRPLDEDFENASPDPLHEPGKHTNFDWEGLFHSIGEDGPDMEAAFRLEVMAVAAKAMRELLRWQVEPYSSPLGGKGRKGMLGTIARRVLALAWALDPTIMQGAPSLRRMAKYLKCDMMAIGKHSSSARRKFWTRNRSASHAWNFGQKRIPKPLPKTVIAKASFTKPKRRKAKKK